MANVFVQFLSLAIRVNRVERLLSFKKILLSYNMVVLIS